MGFGRWNIRLLAVGLTLLLSIIVAVVMRSGQNPVAFPLTFIGYTNSPGDDVNAVFQFTPPSSRNRFFDFDTWKPQRPEVLSVLKDGTYHSLTNTFRDVPVVKPGTNYVFEVQVLFPTNATEFVVTFHCIWERGLSIGGSRITVLRKPIVFQSDRIVRKSE